MPVIYGFSAYMGNPYMGRFCMEPYMGLYFFSNNAVIKINMNFHKNVILPHKFYKIIIGFHVNFAKKKKI